METIPHSQHFPTFQYIHFYLNLTLPMRLSMTAPDSNETIRDFLGDSQQPSCATSHSVATITHSEMTAILAHITELTWKLTASKIVAYEATQTIADLQKLRKAWTGVVDAWKEKCPDTENDDTMKATLENDKNLLEEITKRKDAHEDLPEIYHRIHRIVWPTDKTFHCFARTVRDEYVSIAKGTDGDQARCAEETHSLLLLYGNMASFLMGHAAPGGSVDTWKHLLVLQEVGRHSRGSGIGSMPRAYPPAEDQELWTGIADD